MRMSTIALGAVAVAATWMIFTTDSHAQGRPGRGGPGISPSLGRGVPLAGAGRLGTGLRVPRRGVDTIFNSGTGHEFARTIPRVFGESILPYYALYPPVYYSLPVPRPYGFSPFALPPGKLPAEGFALTPPEEPEVTINPFFKSENPDAKEAEPSDKQTVSKPQFIENPYYVKQLTPEQSKKLAGTAKPDPSVVGLR